jgi:hypothetical protein
MATNATEGLNICGFLINPKNMEFIDWVLAVAFVLLLIMVALVFLCLIVDLIRFTCCDRDD